MPACDRSSHAGKTLNERSAYQRYIRRLDSQPTVDESTDFEPSVQAGQELAESTSARARPVPLSFKLQKHLARNWVNYLVAVALCIAVWLLYDVWVNYAILNHDVTTQSEQINKLGRSLDQITETNHQQDLTLREI